MPKFRRFNFTEITTLDDLQKIMSRTTVALDFEFFPPETNGDVIPSAIGLASLDPFSSEMNAVGYAIENKKLRVNLANLEKRTYPEMVDLIETFILEERKNYIVFGANDAICLDALLKLAKKPLSQVINIYDIAPVLCQAPYPSHSTKLLKLYDAAKVIELDTTSYIQHHPQDDAALLLQMAHEIANMSTGGYSRYQEKVFFEMFGVSREGYEQRQIKFELAELNEQIEKLIQIIGKQGQLIDFLEKKLAQQTKEQIKEKKKEKKKSKKKKDKKARKKQKKQGVGEELSAEKKEGEKKEKLIPVYVTFRSYISDKNSMQVLPFWMEMSIEEEKHQFLIKNMPISKRQKKIYGITPQMEKKALTFQQIAELLMTYADPRVGEKIHFIPDNTDDASAAEYVMKKLDKWMNMDYFA